MLTDTLSRTINYLRISVTDRCNLRCRYCMPEEGVEQVRHTEILTFEELIRCVQVAASLGIEKIRITGGEPLVRKGLIPFITKLARIPRISDLALTTNGTMLTDAAVPLKEAGLHRVNVSLDSLRPDRFRTITRRDMLPEVWRGIQAALAAGLHPVKINVVLLKGFNDDEILDFVRLTLEQPLIVRFIELMPMGGNDLAAMNQFVPGEEVLRIIGESFPLRKIESESDRSAAARSFQIPEAMGKFGVITPMSDHFCSRCNRLRITPDGQIRSCLLSEHSVDLRKLLRRNCSDAHLAEVFRECARTKPDGRLLPHSWPRKCSTNMSRIGG